MDRLSRDDLPESVDVTLDHLERALLVWLRVMPASIWRDFEKIERARKDKLGDAREAADPKAELAAYLASKFRDANWRVSHRRVEHLGSPPPFREP